MGSMGRSAGLVPTEHRHGLGSGLDPVRVGSVAGGSGSGRWRERVVGGVRRHVGREGCWFGKGWLLKDMVGPAQVRQDIFLRYSGSFLQAPDGGHT